MRPRDLCLISLHYTGILPARSAPLTVEGSLWYLVKTMLEQRYGSVQRCENKHRFNIRKQGILSKVN